MKSLLFMNVSLWHASVVTVCKRAHIRVSVRLCACERCWALEKQHMHEQSMWVGKHMRLVGLGSGKPHLFITEMSL